ncbi:MAG TPA: chloride channel protein [Acidobacteriaceae bacterium]|jgi:CIC family chloride channel protein|nr:chloride channel protein [Acidobacteriaceae bacterium]
MSTTETSAQSKTTTDATALPENAAKETMPSVEPLQMSQIDMLKIAPTRDERLFLVLSIFIGIISGLLVVSFRVAISWIQTLTLGSALQPGLLRLIFVPMIMGLVVAALVQWFFPAAGGSGVNQTKAALYIYNGYISFKTVIGKFITSALALGGGFSLGPEDPSLQIGAGVASVISRRLGMSRQRLRLFAPVGAAAGLAAAFNAPIAAILFVIEEVIGRWSAAVLGSVVLSAISSVVVARRFWGSEPMFQIPSLTQTDSRELLAYAVLGVIGGLAASIFSHALGYLRPRLRNLPRWTFFVQSPVAGLCVGLIGFVGFPQVMGPGYEVMNQAMHGQFTWKLLLALALLKILATTVSFSSGTPGGMFAPTLFIGAMLGASIGTFEKIFYPNLHITVGAYALVGMGVLFAAFLRVPLTSVFMVLEMSGNYSIILPVILANTIAYLVSRSLQPSSIFEVFTHQDGLDLPSMEEQREEVVLHLEDALRPLSVPVIEAGTTLKAAAEELDAKHADVFLIRLPGHAWYSMTRAELASLAAVHAPETVLANVLKPDRIPLLFPDLPLDSALPHLARWPILPIQNRASRGAIEGTVTLADVLSRYQAT